MDYTAYINAAYKMLEDFGTVCVVCNPPDRSGTYDPATDSYDVISGTLSAAISVSEDSLSIVAGTGTFEDVTVVAIGDELILVEWSSPTAADVLTRGFMGTTAAYHATSGAVTIRYLADYDIPCVLTELKERFAKEEITMGDMIGVGLKNVFIASKNLDLVPQQGGLVVISDKPWSVVQVETVQPGGVDILHKLYVKG